MAPVKRSAVLDVAAPCDRVIRLLSSRDPSSFLAGAARLSGQGEKRGVKVLTFASARYGSLRVEAEERVEADRLELLLRGDLHGSVRVVGVSKGSGCRLYLEAEGEGKLVEEYGGDALSRVINRIMVTLVSVFPATLQPRVSGGRLGDYFIELLELINLAQGGSARIQGRLRSIAVDLSRGVVINSEGLGEEEASTIARALSDAYSRLVEALGILGDGEVSRLVVSGDKSLIVANVAGKISVATVLQQGGGEEAGASGSGAS
ncbi:hypothetical protein CF15_06930 [Pyrodictium occultum]|uniref:Uncharacterized protein n=1 Tax=Pyrodictium occultum TaxID=2309 RepID=A0A0V8RWP4_PYROC|nr:hypothetical protein [Pyrodictium occultum]KSW12452.1 hypothetical protein CF15_06930 [Pyrodictium occultum]